ncbi:unnamed protein product, partial [Polarella glacialis]
VPGTAPLCPATSAGARSRAVGRGRQRTGQGAALGGCSGDAVRDAMESRGAKCSRAQQRCHRQLTSAWAAVSQGIGRALAVVPGSLPK